MRTVISIQKYINKLLIQSDVSVVFSIATEQSVVCDDACLHYDTVYVFLGL